MAQREKQFTRADEEAEARGRDACEGTLGWGHSISSEARSGRGGVDAPWLCVRPSMGRGVRLLLVRGCMACSKKGWRGCKGICPLTIVCGDPKASLLVLGLCCWVNWLASIDPRLPRPTTPVFIILFNYLHFVWREAWGGGCQRTACEGCFSPNTAWVREIELR